MATKNTEKGTRIFISSFLSSTPESFSLDVPGHFLPTLECGINYSRCNVLIYEYKLVLYIIFPSNGGFLWITYRKNQTPEYRFEKVSRKCNPTKFFYGDGVTDYRVLLACFNLTRRHDDGLGSLHLLEFTYTVSNNETAFHERRSSPREAIYGTETVSEAVRTQGVLRHGCASNSELYTFDQSFPVHVYTDITLPLNFIFDNQIENCSEYYSVVYAGEARLILYCTNQNAVVYNTCTNEKAYYSLYDEGIPYPCSASWSKVVYLREDTLVLTSSGSNRRNEYAFPVNISFGKCVGPLSKPSFWGLDESGHLYSVSLNGKNHTIIELVSSDCSTNATCLRPIFGQEDKIGTYFNPDTMNVTVVNFEDEHLILPPVSISFHPDMYTVYSGPGSHICNHSPIGTDSIPEGPTTTSTTSGRTNENDSDMPTTTSTVSESVTEFSVVPIDSSSGVIFSTGVPIITVLVLIIALSITIIV